MVGFRVVSMLIVFQKCFAGMVWDIIEQWLAFLANWQLACKGRQCVDGVFACKKLMDHSRNFQFNLVMQKFDASIAFDCIHISEIATMIEEEDMPNILKAFVLCEIMCNGLCAHLDNNVTETPHKSGCRQGVREGPRTFIQTFAGKSRRLLES